jgi:GntR family transcriptional regulator
MAKPADDLDCALGVTPVGTDQIRHWECPDADLVVFPDTLAANAAAPIAHLPVRGITLIPDQTTRVALAGVPPEANVGPVSYLDDFLPTHGISRFAPHVGNDITVPRGFDGLPGFLSPVDVLICATGAGHLRDTFPT